VEAACSKHRRTDVLPLHPDLAKHLQRWIRGLSPDEHLFPKLGNRRTWLMVKKDLERVGISYETHEGIADFHAAGRHTYITELLRNGATLPEAKELARHTDVKMTMKYTHIGMGDRARALAKLPTPSCQRPASGNPDSDGQRETRVDAAESSEAGGNGDGTHVKIRGSDTGRQKNQRAAKPSGGIVPQLQFRKQQAALFCRASLAHDFPTSHRVLLRGWRLGATVGLQIGWLKGLGVMHMRV
jgi:hypothetical protein